MKTNKKTGGLAGITAGETELCTVGKEGAGLTYCGYDIYDLVDNASFEEVAYLLLRGSPPSSDELMRYKEKLKRMRDLPGELKKVLEMIPENKNFVRSKDDTDLIALRLLSEQFRLNSSVRSSKDIRLLWEVCQIPDFRKLSETDHANLLSNIFLYLRV